MLTNIVVGLMVVAGGFALMYYSNQLTSLFGRFVWAEQNLGSTRNFYIFGGFIVTILGFFFMFGLIQVSEVQDGAIDSGFGWGTEIVN